TFRVKSNGVTAEALSEGKGFRRTFTASRGAVAMSAADFLGTIGAKEAIGPLFKMARADDPDLRRGAIRGLTQMVKKHPSIGPQLLALCQEIYADRMNPQSLRLSATAAMAAVGKIGVMPLIKAIEDQDAVVRKCALESLHSLGPQAAPAISGLLR